jgi:hypothetical protein
MEIRERSNPEFRVNTFNLFRTVQILLLRKTISTDANTAFGVIATALSEGRTTEEKDDEIEANISVSGSHSCGREIGMGPGPCLQNRDAQSPSSDH